MKQFKTIMCLFTLVFAFAFIAQAQEKSAEPSAVELETTVVTATKSPRTVKGVPSSTSVIDSYDIELSGEATIDEVLRDEAGVFVVRPSGIISHCDGTLTLRGMTWGRTLIMLDGTPLNDPYAQNAVMDTIPIESIERVEIVRGASSALYGTNAIGGVINIITKEPEEEFSINAKGGYGNMGTYESFVDMSGKRGKWGLRLSGGTFHTDGYMPYTDEYVEKFMKGYYNLTPIKEEMDRDKFYGKIIYDLTEGQKLSFTTILNADDMEGPAKNKESNIDNVRYILGWKRSSDKLNWEVKGYINNEDMGFNKTTSMYGVKDQVEYKSDGDFDILGFNATSDFPVTSWWKLITGLEYKDGEGGWTYKYFLVDRDLWIKGKQKVVSGFFSNEFEATDKLTLFLGGRYDWWESYDGESYDSSAEPSPTHYPSKKDGAFCPKAGLVYDIGQGYSLRASAGTAFRSPSLMELYGTWLYYGSTYASNPDLGPEDVLSYEVGMDKVFGTIGNVRLTLYYNKIDDWIGSVLVPEKSDPANWIYYYEYRNIAEASTRGIELSTEWILKPYWTFFANYTYNSSEIDKYPGNPEYEGNDLARTPNHMASWGTTFDHPALCTAKLSGHYRGKSYDYLTNTEETVLDSYTTWDITLSRDITKNLKASLKAINIFDKKTKEFYRYCESPGSQIMFTVSVGF